LHERTGVVADAAVVAAISAVLVALVTGVLAIIGGRKKASSDVQVSINAGFETLIHELREERKELMAIIKQQAVTIEGLEIENHNYKQRIRVLERRSRLNGKN
jgi:hypothetical protein